MAAREGAASRSEALFRKRNARLIALKKAHSNYRCEACGMRYEDTYGEVGRDHIVAHHLKPIGARKKPTVTKIEDIALVCANCHDMIHRHGQLLSIRELRRTMQRIRARGLGDTASSL